MHGSIHTVTPLLQWLVGGGIYTVLSQDVGAWGPGGGGLQLTVGHCMGLQNRLLNNINWSSFLFKKYCQGFATLDLTI